MLTNSAKAAGSPANSAMKATEENQVRQTDSAPGPRQSTRPRKQTVRYGHEASASSSSDQSLHDEEDNFVQDKPATIPERQIVNCRIASASGKNKLRALLIGGQMTPESPPESSKGTSKKRKSPLSNAPDVEGSESATGSADNAPKKQRRQTAKEKAESEATAVNVQESFPKPRGQPEVWAEVSRSPREFRESRADLTSGPPELMRVACMVRIREIWHLSLGWMGLWLAARQ